MGLFLWNLWNSQEQWWLLLKICNMLLCNKNYVGHKVAIFNAALFTLLHLLLTRWWDMRLKHDVAWLWKEQADNRNMCQSKKKYCSCSITLIRIYTIVSKNIYNNFQNLVFRKLLAQSGDQTTYFGNFTCPQTYYGWPKPLGETLV